MKVIGPLKLKVLRGTVNIEAGSNADGVKVLLVNGSEKRQIPKLPYKVEIDTSKGYQIVASKKGYSTVTLPVKFEDGKDQQQFTINLRKDGEGAAGSDSEASSVAKSDSTPSAESIPTVSHSAPSSGSGSDPRKARIASASPPPATHTSTASTPAASKTSSAASATGQGTLNINSIPQSNVLLDGRPLGKTPKAGVSVSGGSHTVVFIHPEHGRKQVVVTVIPGRAATAAVRFP
jgi:serine/threonine-protein kinase